MKKSDKLLLGGFLALLLLISAIHITLYAKYKSGDYTVYNEQEDLAAAMQLFPNILVVSLRDVHGATVRFDQVAAVEKDREDGLQYVQKGDTLMISRKAEASNNGEWKAVNINLPQNVRLSAFNSSIYFRPSKDSTSGHCSIQLQKSSLSFFGTPSLFRLGHVELLASDQSTISFRGNVVVDSLEARLSNSSMDYEEGEVRQLVIETDAASRISLPGKHLAKATIRPLTPR